MQQPMDDNWSFSPLAEELLIGLHAKKKYINPKFFYNAHGSELFDQITKTPEYYPTRTEHEILSSNAEEIADYLGKEVVFIEPGAGTCEKIKHLLPVVKPVAYLPQDISATFLQETAVQLQKDYNWLRVVPIIGDFSNGLDITDPIPEGRRVIFYPGSTIGNFHPEQALTFLRQMRDLVGHQGAVLIGVDLQKEASILNAAYNDQQGITAAFNLNVLNHINELLNTNFNPDTFQHHAYYNPDKHRIEMYLESLVKQTISCNGSYIHFAERERIHTECSYKYTVNGMEQLAQQAQLKIAKSWLDSNNLFSIHYLTALVS